MSQIMSPTSASPAIYQLRVVLRGISPLIWRRLLVPAGTTIAGLHDILQAAFGWSGEHLHCFTVHGTEYGICYAGGPIFRDDARRVRLGGTCAGIRTRGRTRTGSPAAHRTRSGPCRTYDATPERT